MNFNFITSYYSMELFMTLFVAALFVVLTPGILVTLPSKGSKITVAIVHGLIFAVIYHLTRKAVSHFLRSHGLSSTSESFQTNTTPACVEAQRAIQAAAAAVAAAKTAVESNSPTQEDLKATARAAVNAAGIAKAACTP